MGPDPDSEGRKVLVNVSRMGASLAIDDLALAARCHAARKRWGRNDLLPMTLVEMVQAHHSYRKERHEEAGRGGHV